LCAANVYKQRTEGRVVLRRLNRVEYENNLHDLLSIDVPLQHFLPEDAALDGFDNVALGLRLSMLHMQQYLEAADAAISAAIDLGRRPPPVKKRLRYQDEESVQDDAKKTEKKTFRVLPDAVVIFDDNSPTVLRRWIVQNRGLFGDLPVKEAEPARRAGPRRGASAFTIAPGDPRAAAAMVLRDFAARAFRRPVSSADFERFVKLACTRLDDGLTFEDALQVAFRAVITSPRFLFLEEPPGRLDDWALACRLSYFLWSTIPDDELRKLASEGSLSQPAILRGQVERMLASAKANAFVDNFVGQWLELRQIDFTIPDRKLYPEFDDILKAAMVGETQAFFAQMLHDDSKLKNFIHSDFLMLNRCIAEHYKIDGVTGEEFRRMPLPAGSHRGGLLTQASILKVTANGTYDVYLRVARPSRAVLVSQGDRRQLRSDAVSRNPQGPSRGLHPVFPGSRTLIRPEPTAIRRR